MPVKCLILASCSAISNKGFRATCASKWCFETLGSNDSIVKFLEINLGFLFARDKNHLVAMIRINFFKKILRTIWKWV
jgi:hypothetical protein